MCPLPARNRLGQAVRHYRAVNHVGRSEASRRFGISRPTLDLIESNRANPRLCMLDRIASVLGKEAWELIR